MKLLVDCIFRSVENGKGVRLVTEYAQNIMKKT